MKFNIIECKEADLQDLYDGSALTFEGTTLDDDNLEFLIRWLNEHDCDMKVKNFYKITGKLMNDTYHLTGDNAYPNMLTILCIKLDDLTNPSNIFIPRFELGGRWFDDIVENNARREEDKRN